MDYLRSDHRKLLNKVFTCHLPWLISFTIKNLVCSSGIIDIIRSRRLLSNSHLLLQHNTIIQTLKSIPASQHMLPNTSWMNTSTITIKITRYAKTKACIIHQATHTHLQCTENTLNTHAKKLLKNRHRNDCHA